MTGVTQAPAAPAGPRHVLVIETSQTLGLMICSLLRRWGFVAEQATQAAPPDLTVARFDLMISEPMLREPILERVRQDARAIGVPWLALLPSEATGLSADAEGWVQKPIRPQELHDAVLLCLKRSMRGRKTDGVDIDAIVALWDSTESATFRKVARVFLGEMEQRLKAMTEALETQNRGGLLIEAHSVGSAADNMGCTALARAARALEAEAGLAPLPELATLAQAVRSCAQRDLPTLARLIGVDVAHA